MNFKKFRYKWVGLCLFCFSFCVPHHIYALKREFQIKKDTLLVIQDVKIIGNFKTKEKIILRELDIGIGDTLNPSKIDTILFRNKNKIFNTNLFVTVDLTLKSDSIHLGNILPLILEIRLKERFYTFPLVIFELADRNFSEWIYQRGADIFRTNIGMRFIQRNVFGKNQRLELLAQVGFTYKYGISYTIPYIDRTLKNGLEIKASYQQNKSVAYKTLNHKLEYFPDGKQSDDLLKEKLQISFAFLRRNRFYSYHRLELKFSRNTIADTIKKLNPDYFNNNVGLQQFFSLRYEFRRDLRDNNAYPLRGKDLKLEFQKDGLLPVDNLDIWQLTATYARYFPVSKSWQLYFDSSVKGRYTYLEKQPYSNAQGLGYDEVFLRGFELYVIDGQSFFLNQNTLKKRIFNTIARFKYLPFEQFRTIPVGLYLTAYTDFGYVNDRFFLDASNRFSNKLIYGFGAGADFITYYNIVLRFNYAVNSAGETGFYFSFKGDF